MTSFDLEFLEAVLGRARRPGADSLIVPRSYAKPPGSSANYLQVLAPGIFFLPGYLVHFCVTECMTAQKLEIPPRLSADYLQVLAPGILFLPGYSSAFQGTPCLHTDNATSMSSESLPAS